MDKDLDRGGVSLHGGTNVIFLERVSKTTKFSLRISGN